MARFIVERTFADGLRIPVTDQGKQACLSVVGTNAELGVTWLQSYVTADHGRPSASMTHRAQRRSARPPN